MKQQGVSGKLLDVGPEVEWKDANLTRMDLLNGIDYDRPKYVLSEELAEPFNWPHKEDRRRYKEYSEWLPTTFATEHLEKNKSESL